MPLRSLLYIGRIYEKITENDDIYKEKLIPIPKPEFYVLYNGEKSYPDEHILRLSDAFAHADIESPPSLELTVNVLNINKGHNEDKTCKTADLDGYVTFIDKTRTYEAIMSKQEAIRKAIQDCINQGVLAEYLKLHASEVENMLFTEWNWDDAKRVWQEESREEGREEGRGEGKKEDARNMKADNMPIDKIAKYTGLSQEVITAL